MATNNENQAPRATRLFSYYLRATEEGPCTDSVMLCEVIGDEIQSVSLRVASDPMKRLCGGVEGAA